MLVIKVLDRMHWFILILSTLHRDLGDFYLPITCFDASATYGRLDASVIVASYNRNKKVENVNQNYNEMY